MQTKTKETWGWFVIFALLSIMGMLLVFELLLVIIVILQGITITVR